MAAPRRSAWVGLLEHEHGGALGDDEAVTAAVEGPAGAGRVVVARRERAHGREATDEALDDGRLGAAGQHHLGVAAEDRLGRLADGVAGRGAGADRGVVRAQGAGRDGDLAGRHVGDGHGHEERADADPGPRSA